MTLPSSIRAMFEPPPASTADDVAMPAFVKVLSQVTNGLETIRSDCNALRVFDWPGPERDKLMLGLHDSLRLIRECAASAQACRASRAYRGNHASMELTLDAICSSAAEAERLVRNALNVSP